MNSFYTRSFDVMPGSQVGSQRLEDEYKLVEQGFDKVQIDVDTANAAAATATAAASTASTHAQSAAQSAATALALSNFKGTWASLSGALNKPASVLHNGEIWVLLNNLANVAGSQPGVSADWFGLSATSTADVTGDWNTAPARGGTFAGVSLANAPIPGRLIVVQTVDSSGFITQVAYPTTEAFGRIYFRQKQGGTWRAWRQFSMQQESIIAATGTIDLNLGARFYCEMTGNRTFVLSNVPAAGVDFGFQIELYITAGVATWFAGVKWKDGAVPTLTVAKRYLFYFVRDNAGTGWFGSLLGPYNP